MDWNFDHSLARDLEGFYAPWKAAEPPGPRMVIWNDALAQSLGLPAADEAQYARWFSGAEAIPGSQPLALAYAGHQFGNFNPQLGDGRALLVGELIDPQGQRWDVQFKGSGPTPFSRQADGRLALGPGLREYLISEAMAALGIPSTRSLCVVATGDGIWRETPHPAAVVTRIASSHLRIGTFEWAAAHVGREAVERLTAYALKRHFPARSGARNPALTLLEEVTEVQAALVAKWMSIGFVHGVMNTDNVTISGETIDYGPCAYLDAYAAGQVFSSIDAGGRYAFGNQAVVCRWNLYRLASALIEAIVAVDEADGEAARELLAGFEARFDAHWLAAMRPKLGLCDAQDGDLELARALFAQIEGQGADFTRLFRALARSLDEGYAVLGAELTDPAVLRDWHGAWLDRLARDSGDAAGRAARMDAVNPVYIPRNHLTDAALAAAEAGDMAPFHQLLALVTRPFAPVAGMEQYEFGAPAGSPAHVTYCGT